MKSTSRVADGDVSLAPTNCRGCRSAAWPLPARRQVDRCRRTNYLGAVSTSVRPGWQRRHADLLRPRSTSRNTSPAMAMAVSVNARSAGKLTINVLGDRLLTTQTIDGAHPAGQNPRRQGLGNGAYVMTLRRLLSMLAAQRMPTRDRPEMVRHRQERPHAAGQSDAASAGPSGIGIEKSRSNSAAQSGRDAPRWPRSMSASLNLTQRRHPMNVISASVA